MSSEGVTLLSRAALVILMVVVASIFHALVGPGRRRSYFMLAGTLGGIAVGTLAANLTLRWTGIDASVILACLGMTAGWAVAWLFARRLPREAN